VLTKRCGGVRLQAARQTMNMASERNNMVQP
jgi:hypothetical protein